MALLLSVGLHAIIACFFPARHTVMPQERITAQRITVSKRKPAPKVAHIKRRRHHVLKPHVILRDPAPKTVIPLRKHHGGKASPHIHIVRLHPRAIPRPVSFAKNKSTGVTNGGIGTMGINAGIGGENGVGSGLEGKGRSNAGHAAEAPCGFVEFKPLLQERREDKQIVWVQIIVHLRNGETVTDDLHWPFVYAGDTDNPWSQRNLRNANFQTTMQLPPPDFSLETEQAAATVLAVRQTGPDGYTLLEPCPEQPER
jgi:hypothetical protein